MVERFVDYLSNPFSNLINTPTVIVETTKNNLWIQSIIVTNTGDEDLRVNLKFIRKQISSVPATDPTILAEIFLAKDFLVPSYRNSSAQQNGVLYNTVDLVKILGLPINLQFTAATQTTGKIIEELAIYSNSPTQIFDCCVVYSRLNELPMS